MHAYLNFDGTCAEAFQFYAKLLGGRVEEMVTADAMPEMGLEESWGDRLLHARLVVGDSVILASDSPSGQHVPAAGMQVSIHVEDTAEAERIFHSLAEGGQVTMPIAETPWSPRFGMLVDRFGTPWMVNCELAR